MASLWVTVSVALAGPLPRMAPRTMDRPQVPQDGGSSMQVPLPAPRSNEHWAKFRDTWGSLEC